ncbi:glycosyltransferase family 2 protein [Sebaldella sp. S0638]|uniref:glycosyltransferase family 2 protein n=1 Tax=Sebaldella sp. S0638 TaxID=2957809 RepID=UPI00209D9A1A|nr:glycosyltransferase family 2 protein [Sebaldella sp. S0638]MCP1223397.1 glycosyltransferase family 2 protein [Sebaldella sp. S0638]
MNFRIEILMTTYNGEEFLREQLDSIIRQSYKNWNLKIRDDFSNDNTLKILSEYCEKESRIQIIEDDKGNLGIVKNFEELLKYSDAEFVMFADQDDIWLDNKIEEFHKVIIESDYDKEEMVLIHSDSYVYFNNKVIRDFIGKKALKKGIRNYFFEYIVQGSSTMVNRKIIDASMPFLDEVYLHDRYFHILAELFGKRYYIPTPLINYRQHEKNQIGSGKSIFYNIFHKRYFFNKDRKLIEKILHVYSTDINKNNKKLIMDYLGITNTNFSHLKRLHILRKSGIYMNFKKKFSLLFRG